MILARCLGLAILALSAVATEPILLENAFVRVSVDPRQGGAVTGLTYKKAYRFDFIANKGAGIAGSGALFAPVVEAGGKSAGTLAMHVSRHDNRALTLAASIQPGLSLERRMYMTAEQSALSIDDVIRNDSAHDVSIRIGATSRQQAEPWRLTDRTWVGDESAVVERHTPVKDPDPVRLATRGSFFWRQIEQYGTGFLYRVKTPDSAVELSEDLLVEKGNPVQFNWKSRDLTVPAHGSVTVESMVSIDEGGGAPDQSNAFAPLLVRSDAAVAGRSGQPFTAFATVVSPEPRKVRITVSTDRELTHADVALQPGKVARVPVVFSPANKGDLAIHVVVAENGKEIGAATSHAIIDGDPANETWKNYVSKMPEEYYHGTWKRSGSRWRRTRITSARPHPSRYRHARALPPMATSRSIGSASLTTRT